MRLQDLNDDTKERAHSDYLNSYTMDFNPFDYDEYYKDIIEDSPFEIYISEVNYSIGGNGDGVTFQNFRVDPDKLGLSNREKFIFDFLDFKIANSGFECTIDQQHFYGPSYPHCDNLATIIEQKIDHELRELSDKLYTALRNEYEYLTSFEAFEEMCDCNEWEFTEEGVMI